ncbi:MAG: hypothetical protein IJ667_11720 [Synergistaceae bacterium]|nr:hypothetical protein [Synergistaceae bacterium]
MDYDFDFAAAEDRLIELKHAIKEVTRILDELEWLITGDRNIDEIN